MNTQQMQSFIKTLKRFLKTDTTTGVLVAPKRFNRRRFTTSVMVFVFLFVGLFLTIVQRTDAATGDILAVRILGNTCAVGTSCNGFSAEIDIEGLATGGTYDLGITESTPADQIHSNAKIRFTVTSPGYDTNGNATSTTRTVYGTRTLRQAYPSQAIADETAGGGQITVRISLSEFIYVDDTVTVDIQSGFYTQAATPNNSVADLGVTNNSTYAYPKPIGRWSWAPYERITSDFLIESTIFHRFARNGKPLAAIKYTCTDENSHSITQTVNDMTVSARADSAGTGNKVLVYATMIPVASFDQGDVITCNFVAYPWVGNATSLLNSDLIANGGDGFDQPDDRLGPFMVLNDKDGTYGTPCAIVSSTGQASATSTWVFNSCAAAEAAYAGNNALAYANLGYATQAVRTYNNANHGHNDPGGGTIELLAENYTTAGNPSATTLGAQDTWLTIQPASTVPCHTPVINANVSTATQNVQKIKYSCISTSVATGNTFRGNTSYTDVLWLDEMKLNHADSSWVRYWDVAYATRNTVDALPTMGFTSFSSVRSPWGLIRGNFYTPLLTSSSTPVRAELYNVLGNRNVKTLSRFTNADGRHISDNAVWAFNSTFNDDNNDINFALSSNTHTSFTSGVAFVQNVIESVNAAGVSPNIGIENMGGTDNINNLIAWHNTSRGQRSNVAYASDADHCTTAVPLFTNWTWKFNLESNNNRINETRDDHGCPADSGRTGNWSMDFMVGGAGNALAVGGGPSWSQPVYLGLNSMGDPATEGFVSDKSSTTYGGTGGGHGDYHLTSGSAFRSIVPSGEAVLPYDIEGNTRYNNGLGSIGAYEFVLSADKAITGFDFNGLVPAVTGSINETNHTIAATVPFGTDVTALVPTISITGASVNPNSGAAQDFTNPVVYTVTAEDGTTQNYTVTVTVESPPPSSDKAITGFSFNNLTPTVSGTINETNHTIAATVPYGTNVTALVPTITFNGASINPSSGVAQNFANPVIYTVTAADSSTQDYTATVTVASAPPSEQPPSDNEDDPVVPAPSGNTPNVGDEPSDPLPSEPTPSPINEADDETPPVSNETKNPTDTDQSSNTSFPWGWFIPLPVFLILLLLLYRRRKPTQPLY